MKRYMGISRILATLQLCCCILGAMGGNASLRGQEPADKNLPKEAKAKQRLELMQAAVGSLEPESSGSLPKTVSRA